MTHRLISPEEASALIRRSVRQFASDKVEGVFESAFYNWTQETLFPEAVNRLIEECRHVAD